MPKFFTESEFDGDRTHPIAVNLRLSLPDMQLPPELLDLAVRTNIDDGKSPNAFAVYAFSETTDVQGVLLILYGQMDNGMVSNLSITARRRPKEPPPESAIEGNHKTGGYPDALNRIFAFFPRISVKCGATARFYCPKTPFESTPKEKDNGAFKFTGKRLLFEATNPLDGTLILIQVESWPVPEGAMLDVEANIEISFSPSCIQEAAELLWQQVSSLVKVDDE